MQLVHYQDEGFCFFFLNLQNKLKLGLIGSRCREGLKQTTLMHHLQSMVGTKLKQSMQKPC